MPRTRLVGAALLFLAFLPGCGILTGDRRTLCERWRDCRNGGQVDACPVSYPVIDSGGANGCAMPIPGGIPYQGPPIYMGGPGASVPLGSETLPQPGGTMPMPPRIPRAGIDEGKGKQFELEGASRSGPIGPALPTGGTK
jgi:hypothetical protein